MIQGIFYARFFPKEGPRIVAQSPCNLIGPPKTDSLLDSDLLQSYIIPRKPFFNRLLTATDPDGKYAVLSYPVLIAHEKYFRNEFIFNFGLVVEVGGDGEEGWAVPYERVVRRLAVTFSEMEVQDGYLSGQELEVPGPDEGAAGGQRKKDGEGKRSVEGLLEIVREDLNNYGECLIPVDDANTINMKLFPHYRSPPEIKGWHVPVPKMKLSDVADPTWDITVQKVIAQVDGASDVRRIAYLADVSLDLAKTALRHLLYYDTILLLDMFFFANCYAPRPGVADFVRNADGMVDECAAYACIHSRQRLSNYHLIKLMTTFCAGRSVTEWLALHRDAGLDVLRYLDVRRFVQFGVIRGCLYRVHKYVVSKQYLAALATGQVTPVKVGDEADEGDEGDEGAEGDEVEKAEQRRLKFQRKLKGYTNGQHCFDQITTEMNLTNDEITEGLKSLPLPSGDLTVFYR